MSNIVDKHQELLLEYDTLWDQLSELQNDNDNNSFKFRKTEHKLVQRLNELEKILNINQTEEEE